ncbi:hypothetical protein shim_04750 [Shimia sp. SK013]|uniref:hypothetical protein n=1 Tax=Shimia sp. SK013 TaxID=1389006 RepID=UPI0006B4D1B1|nr:hypothetical protein [Shimia sp. SK013]KPA23280.1 hypothetical protein shim_04750 [Shimia sp. SK013]
MIRILVHAGFHKTGTTSVQKMLVHNRPRLERHIRFITRPGMIGACEAARAYSASRHPADLTEFASEIAAVFEEIDTDDSRPLVLSSEDLSGHMPGRRNLTRYDAAPHLMKAIADTTQAAFGDGADLTFYFSTRAAEDWMRSCYAQHLRAVRMTLSFEDYCTTFADSAKLDAIVEQVRDSVAPFKVLSTPLEEASTRPIGPLASVMDALDMPGRARRGLEVLPPANVSMPQELLDAMLEANRSDLSNEDVSKAKFEARRIWLTGDI